jgi:hypothetical protein
MWVETSTARSATAGEHVGDQIGFAERDQANAGRDAYVGCTFNGRRDEDGHDEAELSDLSSGNGAAAATGAGGFGFVAVLAVLGYFIFGGDEPFPAASDPWPAEVQQEAVVAAANNWLDKCAKSESGTPANCPQSIVESSDVSKVHWAFYGNPFEAPVIQYSEAGSRFDMLGTVMVSADYTISEEARRVVTPTTYWAKVKWASGKLEVQEIKEHSAIGDPDVVKQDPKLEWESMAAKLKDAFTRCVRGAGLAMPAGCPEWSPPSGAKQVKWSLSGDPLLTARATWDPKFGIYHVKGTYGLAVSYTWMGTTKTESRSPNYEAWIAPTGTGPVVLQIKDASSV